MVDKITVGGSNNPNTPDTEKVKPKDTGATATNNADVGATIAAGQRDKREREDEDDADKRERHRRERSEASDQPKYKEEEIDDDDIFNAAGWLGNLLIKKGLLSRVELLLGIENEAEDKKKAREEKRKRKEERKKREEEEDEEQEEEKK